MTSGIIDAERNLDGPPEGSEGGIKSVEFDPVKTQAVSDVV